MLNSANPNIPMQKSLPNITKLINFIRFARNPESPEQKYEYGTPDSHVEIHVTRAQTLVNPDYLLIKLIRLHSARAGQLLFKLRHNIPLLGKYVSCYTILGLLSIPFLTPKLSSGQNPP